VSGVPGDGEGRVKWFRGRYTEHLETRIEMLEMGLACERIRHDNEERRIRDEARAETEYARRLVASAMLKGGMWNAESATFQRSQQDSLDAPPRPGYEPIHEAVARAQREEQEEFDRLMSATRGGTPS